MMKYENLLAAYRELTKKPYTTRAQLAQRCGFSVMSAGNAAKILLSLGLLREKNWRTGNKLAALDVTYHVAGGDENSLYLSIFDKCGVIKSTFVRRRSYSFPLIEELMLFLRDCPPPSEVFPCLFLVNIPEIEIAVFDDLLPPLHTTVSPDIKNMADYLTDFMLKSKIGAKSIANHEKL